MPAAASLVRLLRRGADAVVIFLGLLATLRLFAVDATPALAGLGVGGIAVALAAQKTLENVIAGASLIFDQAVRVGDTLKMGEFTGTVDHIGLRSTRLRTMDRTIVSIPNGAACERESRDAVGARQVLVPPRRGAAIRDHGSRTALRTRGAAGAPQARSLHRLDVGPRALLPPWTRFPGYRGRGLRPGGRLEPVPGTPGRSALRSDGGDRARRRRRSRSPRR